MMEQENSIEINEKPYRCKIEGCDKFFDDSNQHYQHYYSVHREPVQCTVEGCTRLMKPKYLLDHIRRVHNGEKRVRTKIVNPKPVEKVLCPECNKLISKYHLKIHQNRCTGGTGEIYVCEVEGCVSTFSIRANLMNHVYTVHKAPMKCPQENCNKYLKPSSLKEHMRNSHINKKDQCHNCRKYLRSSTIQKHIKDCEALGTRNFPCTISGCEMRFLTSEFVYKHIWNVHRGQIDCPMDVCDSQIKSSHRPSHIKLDHKKILATCDNCNEIIRSTLKKHLQTCKHNIKSEKGLTKKVSLLKRKGQKSKSFQDSSKMNEEQEIRASITNKQRGRKKKTPMPNNRDIISDKNQRNTRQNTRQKIAKEAINLNNQEPKKYWTRACNQNQENNNKIEDQYLEFNTYNQILDQNLQQMAKKRERKRKIPLQEEQEINANNASEQLNINDNIKQNFTKESPKKRGTQENQAEEEQNEMLNKMENSLDINIKQEIVDQEFDINYPISHEEEWQYNSVPINDNQLMSLQALIGPGRENYLIQRDCSDAGADNIIEVIKIEIKEEDEESDCESERNYLQNLLILQSESESQTNILNN